MIGVALPLKSLTAAQQQDLTAAITGATNKLTTYKNTQLPGFAGSFGAKNPATCPNKNAYLDEVVAETAWAQDQLDQIQKQPKTTADIATLLINAENELNALAPGNWNGYNDIVKKIAPYLNKTAPLVLLENAKQNEQSIKSHVDQKVIDFGLKLTGCP